MTGTGERTVGFRVQLASLVRANGGQGEQPFTLANQKESLVAEPGVNTVSGITVDWSRVDLSGFRRRRNRPGRRRTATGHRRCGQDQKFSPSHVLTVMSKECLSHTDEARAPLAAERHPAYGERIPREGKQTSMSHSRSAVKPQPKERGQPCPRVRFRTQATRGQGGPRSCSLTGLSKTRRQDASAPARNGFILPWQ